MAQNITVRINDVDAATGQVVTAENQQVTDADLATDGMEEIGYDVPTKVGAGVIAGHLVGQVQPVYPMIARQNHIHGTVVLHAIIAKDGHIRDLQVVQSPDPNLAVAAIAAVRQWTYKAYLLNGTPVEVETTINVNFAIN